VKDNVNPTAAADVGIRLRSPNNISADVEIWIRSPNNISADVEIWVRSPNNISAGWVSEAEPHPLIAKI
jgi:head-tail adaptor